jgi:hypothetical protein
VDLAYNTKKYSSHNITRVNNSPVIKK